MYDTVEEEGGRRLVGGRTWRGGGREEGREGRDLGRGEATIRRSMCVLYCTVVSVG